MPGSDERRWAFGRQTKDAALDKNSVAFLEKQMPAFDELRAAIEAAVAAHHTPQAQAPSSSSVADEMA
ncbi:hypothetical protein ACIRQH_39715 [Streptomyces sp. NPDC102279]|uniref:hypothetical protein n=1 Tax=Streptomyces sp. NPDC102279 TaxID=3366153 RepID=UPI003801C43A